MAGDGQERSRFRLPFASPFHGHDAKASVSTLTCSEVPLIGMRDAAVNLELQTGQQESVTCIAPYYTSNSAILASLTAKPRLQDQTHPGRSACRILVCKPRQLCSFHTAFCMHVAQG